MTPNDIFTSSWMHADRIRDYPPSILMRANAGDLCVRVNQLFREWKKTRPENELERIVRSGYRPAAINLELGGERGDAHESCEAVDLEDGDGDLAKWCTENEELLKHIGLCMEQKEYTRTLPNKGVRGWCHLQNRKVPSGKTIFIPYPGPPPEDSP